jgi:hypothetical protein
MHGPKPQSHAIKLQKKVRRLGLKIALSVRTAEGKVFLPYKLIYSVCMHSIPAITPACYRLKIVYYLLM